MLALIADIHSNLEALEACLEHARGQGAQAFAFLGDLVGYNADPVAVVDRVRACVEEGAIAVRGNHDAAVGGVAESMNPAAATAIEWTRHRLRPDQAEFLAGLPLTVRRDDSFFVHAGAAAPERWNYVRNGLQAAASLDAACSRYVFGGHVHEQVLYFLAADDRAEAFTPTPGAPIPVARHRRWLALVGSAGQPRDGSPAACYALFDPARAQLTFHRVPYDHQAAAAKVRAAGLPEEFARRLETGR
ncbi:MAG TPA: metallophosphoesterase family protein [Rhodocyclaceae bacterium]|nr:metallophosphoesterase family protein [Rhodocyclaceae bacterium]